MKRLVINERQLPLLEDDDALKPTRTFNVNSPSELPNMINSIYNTGDTENVNNQIIVGELDKNSATYTVDDKTDTGEIEPNSIVNLKSTANESYTKKDVELMRINEMKKRGIALTKKELNKYLCN